VIDGNIGEQMYKWAHDLFPICRSITGEGVRATLRYLKNWYRRYKSLRCRRETKVLDRTVPDEWNIRDAFIADENASRIVDFRKSNLHVVGYSEPVCTDIQRLGTGGRGLVRFDQGMVRGWVFLAKLQIFQQALSAGNPLAKCA